MHSQYVGYTFIIDLMPNTGLQGFIIKEVLNLRLEGAPIFFYFSDMWISRNLKTKDKDTK